MACPLLSALTSFTAVFAPLTRKVMGVPWGWLTLWRVAVKVVKMPWLGFGDTVAGVKLSVGAGFVGANPHPPALGASLKMVAFAARYRQPSGPMPAEPPPQPNRGVVLVARTVVV